MDNDARVLPWHCGALGPGAVLCGRQRSHDRDLHRGTGAGGRLVTWTDAETLETPTDDPWLNVRLDETAETWTDPNGWTYARGTNPGELDRLVADPLGGLWGAVGAVGPWVVYGSAAALAWLLPALVVIAWRAAL